MYRLQLLILVNWAVCAHGRASRPQTTMVSCQVMSCLQYKHVHRIAAQIAVLTAGTCTIRPPERSRSRSSSRQDKVNVVVSNVKRMLYESLMVNCAKSLVCTFVPDGGEPAFPRFWCRCMELASHAMRGGVLDNAVRPSSRV